MIKAIVMFALYTVGLAVLGSITLIISGVGGSDGDIGTLGVLATMLILLSPLISIFILWIPYQRKKLKRLSLEQDQRAAEELDHRQEEHKNALRRVFLERQRLMDAVHRHRTTLERNLQRAIKKNDYGALVEDRTNEALAEFFASIDLSSSLIDEVEAGELVFEQLDFKKNIDREIGFDPANLPFDGHAFERWVAEALEGYGWEAEITRGSGDQGIDVLARKDGKSVGLQCKLYSNAVGNKAVQEAHAGKAYHNVEAVGVLTNAPFTASARELAQATGVHLLSHYDIPTLDEKVFNKL